MNPDEAYTLEAFGDFLKQAGMEGLINPAAARARRKALEQLADELTEPERRDVRNIDVDELVSRFHKLEGSSIRPETLQLYGQRLSAALSDYLGWLDNPDGFISARREKPRAFTRGSAGRPALTPEQKAAERITLEATENPTNVVPVPIRDDQVVYLANLPLDLTAEEAAKIARIVRAYARDEEPQDERP